MKIHVFITVLLFVCIANISFVLAQSDPNDFEGCKDPTLFNRMAGFYIQSCQELEFDRFGFQIGPSSYETVEGHHFNIFYYANDNVKLPSGLQVIANYTNAAKAVGGQKVYEFEDGGTQYVTLKIAKNNSETWISVSGADNGMYNIDIVEREIMNQQIVADAESLASLITETGKATIYGIYFDTGKSEIKPESEPSLNEIVKLLKTNLNLKLFVVGHTDNVGTFDSNIMLSQSRAAAVTDTLVKKNNIAASRLIPFGAGPTAPVASNNTEEGRAKNRRVELVSQ